MLRIIIHVFVLFMLTVITLFTLNWAFSVISAANTVGVVFGIGTLLMLLLTCLLGVRQVFRTIINDWKRYKSLLVITLFITLSATTGCSKLIPPGYVGIVINLYGTDRGVSNLPLRTGRIWYNPFSEQVFEYPTFVQTAVWSRSVTEGKPVNEEITFSNADQMQVAADISLAYHLVPDKVPSFYQRFRSDELDQFTHGFLRNLARQVFDDVAGKYKIEQIMGDNAKFLKEVRDGLQDQLKDQGVVFDQFGFIGAPRPPQGVINAINAKVKAVQDAIRIENEVNQAVAEAKKSVAMAEGEAKAKIARAEGEAKANQLLTSSLTDNLIKWRQLEIENNAINRWDGRRPVVEGSGGGFLLSLDNLKR